MQVTGSSAGHLGGLTDLLQCFVLRQLLHVSAVLTVCSTIVQCCIMKDFTMQPLTQQAVHSIPLLFVCQND